VEKQHNYQKKGYYKTIQSSSWKTMKIKSLLKSEIIIVISRPLILKVRWINPDNHIHRLRLKWTLQDKCELEIRSKHISKQKSYSKRKTSSVLFYTLVYKISLPLSCNHWMLCITLLWHDLKSYCSSHVTFHCFSLWEFLSCPPLFL